MLRFKKVWKQYLKPSPKLVPAENPTHQITDIDAECGGDTKGEYRSIDLRADVADGTDSTITPDLNHGGGSRIANQDNWSEDQQLPVQNASTPIPGDERGNASERGRLLLSGPTLIPRNSTTRARTHT